MAMRMNSRYVSTHHGIIKIVQIVIGIILAYLMCGNPSWYGGRSCFGDGRFGFASGLNYVILIINIIVFIINLVSIDFWRIERIYAIIATVLFLIASVLLVWYLIEWGTFSGWFIAVTVLNVVMFLLFLYDVRILQGEAPNN